MKDYQKNIVPANNQNKGCMFWDISGSPKILFVGNSITKHEPKPEIGWFNDCGMAATSLEKDYVHLMEKAIREKHPDASFGILQVASFEWDFEKFDIEGTYADARNFSPDIVIMFFSANVRKNYDEEKEHEITFGERYEALRNYLDNGNTRFIHSQGFYIRPVLDEEKEAVAAKHGDIFVNIEDIRAMDETHGGFNHPSDYGMKLIAERFLKYTSEILS